MLFEQVSKWYGAVIGVNQVTLELRGGITGLVGHNGAGKSTLLRLATGQLRPCLGRVTVCGKRAWSWSAKRLVGYVPDADRFYEDMSGQRFVREMAALTGLPAGEARDRADAAVERVGMAGRADRPIRGYSKGMRQRVKIAQALLLDPPLLVLDEPMSGIDPTGRQEFLELFTALAERGTCLLVSSHELEELEKLTDHVAIMARGRIAAVGTLERIRELLDDHPLAVRIDVEQPRELACKLLENPDVQGIELVPHEGVPGAALVVRARQPQRFFRALNRLILDENLDVSRLEPLDDSTAALLGYLLGGSAR